MYKGENFVKLVFIGDSITDANHNYTSDCMGDGYVKIISEQLKKRGENIEIWNKGHDGFTVFGLWKFLEQDCLIKQPDIVSILIGCNDVAIKMNTGKTLEEQGFQEMYEKILKKIRKKTNAEIICMGPFIFRKPAEFVNWIPDICKCEEMAEETARKYNAIFLPLHDILTEEAEKNGIDYISTDGTHLTAVGAEIVAGKWLEATANWLDKRSEIG